MEFIKYYLIIVNVAAFLLFAEDKRRAKREQYRIPEHSLLSAAAVGGSVGAWIAMYVCRHKIRKPKFFIGIPVILFIQTTAGIGIYYYL